MNAATVNKSTISPAICTDIAGLNHLGSRCEVSATLCRDHGDDPDTVDELIHSIAVGWANLDRRRRNERIDRETTRIMDDSRNGAGFPKPADDGPSADMRAAATGFMCRPELLADQDTGRIEVKSETTCLSPLRDDRPAAGCFSPTSLDGLDAARKEGLD